MNNAFTALIFSFYNTDNPVVESDRKSLKSADFDNFSCGFVNLR